MVSLAVRRARQVKLSQGSGLQVPAGSWRISGQRFAEGRQDILDGL